MSSLPSVIEPPHVPLPVTPLPVFSSLEMKGAVRTYLELQQTLDQAMPDQIMAIRGRPFRKKGYWRAIRTAFNLTVTVTEERRAQTDGPGGDWGWVVVYRATAPNGRSADGDGCCYASEKGRGQMSATEHNVRSHAHTRAFNRAVSNLVGFGEVSAEEVTDDQVPTGPQTPAKKKTAAVAKLPPTGPVCTPDQRKDLIAIGRGSGWSDEQMQSYLLMHLGVDSTAAIPAASYEQVRDAFSVAPVDQPF